MKQERMGWQFHQLVHMHIICTSFQRDNHAGISLSIFFTGWILFLTCNQSKLCNQV